jgi:hypothetical protein
MGLPNKNHFKIGNKDFQPYLLGDSAYSLQVGLMKYFSSKLHVYLNKIYLIGNGKWEGLK